MKNQDLIESIERTQQLDGDVARRTRAVLDEAADLAYVEPLAFYIHPVSGMYELCEYLANSSNFPESRHAAAIQAAMMTILRVCRKEGATHAAVAHDRLIGAAYRKKDKETGGVAGMVAEMERLGLFAKEGPRLVINNAPELPDDNPTK